MSKFHDLVSDGIRRIYHKRIHTLSILDTASYFLNAEKFCCAWEVIRKEAQTARLSSAPRFHALMPEQANISANDGLDRRMFIQRAYGTLLPTTIITSLLRHPCKCLTAVGAVDLQISELESTGLCVASR